MLLVPARFCTRQEIFGVQRKPLYTFAYIASILVGATSSLALIINFIDLMFALMAIPTLVSAVLLAPSVVVATRRHWAKSSGENR